MQSPNRVMKSLAIARGLKVQSPGLLNGVRAELFRLLNMHRESSLLSPLRKTIW